MNTNHYHNIKKILPIKQVLEHYNVHPGKNKTSFYCPIHERMGQHKTASLRVSDERGIVTCFSQKCFDSDDIFGFIEKLEQCSKKDALCKAAKIAHYSLEQHITQTTFTDVHPLSSEHIAWLEKRGIRAEFAQQSGIKAKDKDIAFPHRQGSKVCGWKLRNIYDKQKMWQMGMANEKDSNLKAKLWSPNIIEANSNIQHLIFTEGELDCLLLAQHLQQEQNIAVVTSTSGASSLPEDIDQILLYYPYLQKISIFYDNDEAGKEGQQKLAQHLKKHNILIYSYTFHDYKEDITDFLLKGNSPQQLFNLPVEVIATYYSLRPAIETFDKTYLEKKHIPTGFKKLDAITNGGLQGLSIIGGETGTGKTTFMLNIAIHAIKEKHPVLYISYELSYTELRIKLAAMCSPHQYSDLIRNRNLFHEAKKHLENKPIFDYLKIIDSSCMCFDIETIKQSITTLKNEFPNSSPLIIIDYLQGIPVYSARDYRINLVSLVQKLRVTSQQQQVTILLASATNTQRASNKKIHAGIFRETSEIEYSAYTAMVLDYPDENAPRLYVVKNRFGRKALDGIPLQVNWEKQLYREL